MLVAFFADFTYSVFTLLLISIYVLLVSIYVLLVSIYFLLVSIYVFFFIRFRLEDIWLNFSKFRVGVGEGVVRGGVGEDVRCLAVLIFVLVVIGRGASQVAGQDGVVT